MDDILILALLIASILTGCITALSIYSSITTDCEMLGSFRSKGIVYECKKK